MSFYNFKPNPNHVDGHIAGSFLFKDLTNADDPEVIAGHKPLKLKYVGFLTQEECDWLREHSLEEPK